MAGRRWDLLSAIAGILALAGTTAYAKVQVTQGGFPFALVFLIPLAIAVLALAYASLPVAMRKKPALTVAAAVLGPIGLLGILTIGLPLLLAAMLAVGDLARRDVQPMPTSDDQTE